MSSALHIAVAVLTFAAVCTATDVNTDHVDTLNLDKNAEFCREYSIPPITLLGINTGEESTVGTLVRQVVAKIDELNNLIRPETRLGEYLQKAVAEKIYHDKAKRTELKDETESAVVVAKGLMELIGFRVWNKKDTDNNLALALKARGTSRGFMRILRARLLNRVIQPGAFHETMELLYDLDSPYIMRRMALHTARNRDSRLRDAFKWGDFFMTRTPVTPYSELSHEQRSLHLSEDDKYIKGYTGEIELPWGAPTYTSINAAMRSSRNYYVERGGKGARKLDAELSQRGPYKGITERAVGNVSYLKKIGQETYYIEASPLSTSRGNLEKSHLESIAACKEHCGYILEISGHSGIDITWVSSRSDEQEVLFRPGSIFRVVDIYRPTRAKYYRIILEEVPSEVYAKLLLTA